jgi:hypothetical protein
MPAGTFVPGRPSQAGFCGWVGNPPKENKVLKSKDAQPWIANAPGNDDNASMPEQVKRPNPWRKMMMMTYVI